MRRTVLTAVLATSLCCIIAACSGTKSTPTPDAGLQGTTEKCWWCVDGSTGQEAATDTGKTPGTGKDCYDGCIQKGQDTATCTKACGGTPGTPKPGTPSCYDDCIKLPKNPGDKACRDYCNSSTGTNCKTDQDCAKLAKTPVCNQAKGICVAKGGSTPSTCNFGAPCPCYEDCIKQGGTPGQCEPKCYPGGTGIKNKEAEACFNQCIKDGGNKESCYPKCYPLQACKEPCLNGGKSPDECNQQCTKDCVNTCTKAGEDANKCKERCPAPPVSETPKEKVQEATPDAGSNE